MRSENLDLFHRIGALQASYDKGNVYVTGTPKSEVEMLLGMAGQALSYKDESESLRVVGDRLRIDLSNARVERDRLEAERGDWVPGAVCGACKGGGCDDENHTCQSCAGTGEVWKTWKDRAVEAEAGLEALKPRLDRLEAVADKDALAIELEGLRADYKSLDELCTSFREEIEGLRTLNETLGDEVEAADAELRGLRQGVEAFLGGRMAGFLDSRAVDGDLVALAAIEAGVDEDGLCLKYLSDNAAELLANPPTPVELTVEFPDDLYAYAYEWRGKSWDDPTDDWHPGASINPVVEGPMIRNVRPLFLSREARLPDTEASLEVARLTGELAGQREAMAEFTKAVAGWQEDAKRAERDAEQEYVERLELSAERCHFKDRLDKQIEANVDLLDRSMKAEDALKTLTEQRDIARGLHDKAVATVIDLRTRLDASCGREEALFHKVALVEERAKNWEARAKEVENAVLAIGNVNAYDAGLLNDFGGGDVEWWYTYIRELLMAAHKHYSSQIDELQAGIDG